MQSQQDSQGEKSRMQSQQDNQGEKSRWQTLFAELKRRHVFRVGTLYIIILWPIIQIADILSPTLGLPDQVMRYLVASFLAGLPLALILAWIFEFNRGRITVTTDNTDGNETAVPLVSSRTELAIIGLLVILVLGLFFVQLSQNETATVGASTHKSIGVLPFVTFGENQSDQRFADGLTEEMLNLLSRVNTLRVAARTSTFAYRGVSKNVRVIGRELGVSHILEGSVRRNDVSDTIRVSAQLIDAVTGSHLWSKTYDREFKDIFQIQDDIASSVVNELEVTILGDDALYINNRPTAKPEALIAWSLGQTELARRTRVANADAIRFFKRALAADPGFADAWVGLATAYTLAATYGWADEDDYLPLALEAVAKAFELDPESGAAWAASGLYWISLQDYTQARQALAKAIELNPSHAPAYQWYASLMPDASERLEWNQKAYELDPRSPVIGYQVADTLLQLGRHDEAMSVFAQIVEADPAYPGAFEIVARINEHRGRLDEAINLYQRAWQLEPHNKFAFPIAFLYIDLGDLESAREWVAIAEENQAPGEEIPIEWLHIQVLASQALLLESEPLLRKKVTRITPEASIHTLLDGVHAAYFLMDTQSVIRGFELIEQLDLTEAELLLHEQYIEASLAAAWAYQQEGQAEAAKRVLANTGRILKNRLQQAGYEAEDWFDLALFDALSGNEQMMLIHTQRAIDEGWRQYWRPGAEPILDGIWEGDAYQAMMSGLQTRMQLMRQQLSLAETDDDWGV